MKNLWNKLRNIDNKHIHFFYLKHCAGFSKINHIFKTCDIENKMVNNFLDKIDNEFQIEIKRLLNVKLRDD